MDRRGSATVLFAVLISILALAISVIAYARRASAVPPIPPRPTATLKLSMVVATFTGQGMAAHRWFPTMLVVRKGDVVDLAVGNPDKVAHQLEITGYGLKTKLLMPGDTDSLRFAADRDGVFLYRCVLPYDPAKGHCTPDHELMRGYLIVTE
jgi:heme/copper-type cytochrome/quinol oxidase subunit 2